MFENKFVNLLLKIVPQSKWNLLSNLLAKASIPHIGSPIAFRYGDFNLKEFNTLGMSEDLKGKFLDFCYPADMDNREKEIELDRQYWQDASVFLVFNASNAIVGCAQFIPKKEDNKIPIEFAHVIRSKHGFKGGSVYHIPRGNFAEIYRCRRSFELEGMASFFVLFMIFKAVLAKAIQTHIDYSLITYDSSMSQLKKLYINKLSFHDPCIKLHYNNNGKEWNLLVKDWKAHETQFSSISKAHFYMQTIGRKNLKQKNFRIRPLTPAAAQLLSEQDTVLFANTLCTGQKQTSARKQILEEKTADVNSLHS